MMHPQKNTAPMWQFTKHTTPMGSCSVCKNEVKKNLLKLYRPNTLCAEICHLTVLIVIIFEVVD